MARSTRKAAGPEDKQEEPPVEETAVTPSPPPEVETQAAQPEETAVAEAPADPRPEPRKAAKKASVIAPSEMVWVKLVGAKTATINHQAVLLDEAVYIRYSHYTQLRNERPGLFAVKLPGSETFVVE